MGITEFTSKEDIKDIIIQISDYISELEILIDNVNVLSEEMHTNLVNQINSKTSIEKLIIQQDLRVCVIKSGIIREFVLRASEIVNKLAELA